jgi:hypothetical protein
VATTHANQITAEYDGEPTPEDLKKKLEPVGIITCNFYFLDNAQRNPEIHFAQQELEKLDTVNEKLVKGDSLSHQAM